MAEEKYPERFAFGASFVEGLTGLGAVAICIIGLAKIYPVLLGSVATIALGAALVFESGTLSARYSALMSEISGEVVTSARYAWLTTTFLAGAAGIVLGILALLGIASMTLVPVSIMAFGAGLVFDSGARARLSSLENQYSGLIGVGRDLAQESASATAGVEVFIGIAAIALGVLAVIGIQTQILSLVGLLSIAAAVLLVSSVVGGRMAGILHR